MTQTVLDRWSAFHAELDRRAAQIADLRALNAELVQVLEALVKFTEDDWEVRDTQYHLWADARAVIAKAKGEA